ncbi:MAG: fibronectin type III domain-containing protein [Flavobacteriales bacterium]|nr:fibronectin type III domain-containing protein [Flavobacteriales bacterium]
MRTQLLLTLSFLACGHLLNAQTIKVEPYLQDVEPHSIYIMWETDMNPESIVEWGLTEALGNSTEGTAENSEGDAMIHEVQLVDLERWTKYYYRVKTGDATSEIYHFKTPPFATDHQPFRIIAMSDMQRDGAFPDKFNEIVHDGIIDYLDDEVGGDLVDNLALVMIPGDLVVTGTNYSQWENHFFDPSHDLFNHVPVYPVPGNHEYNATYFFQYFKMPENGTEGFEEHWWYKDYGNVRIIGLDSNSPFDNEEQIGWLDALLNNTCQADSIDFVFAQLHHPHKSELWTPGESDYTGEVIALLEEFSSTCNKPSIHFFGHTHGYSRGHSRDHRHLWINAATAGGAIDNWGEFPNFDYDEFSVSQDEYGFVSVEVSDDPEPKIVVKRISRGDQDGALENVLTDSLTIRLEPSPVDVPVPVFPVEEVVAPECVVLEAEAFSSPNELSVHGQSHWQVSTDENDFANLVAESWKNFENWYFEVDTQAEDDLTDEVILGLEENTTYWWRVRYRDRELNWSEWSAPVTFDTGESIALPNLIQNPGAEEDLANWTTVEGIVETLTDGECNGVSPFAGDRYFAVGGLCQESEVGICTQDIDVTAYIDSIDAGDFPVHFGGHLSNFGGSDLPEMRLIYLNQNGGELGTSSTLSTLNSSWTLFNETESLPLLTRTIRVELKGTRNAGTDNDSYFDEVFLRLGTNLGCDPIVSVVNWPMQADALRIYPNPVANTATIQLPGNNHQNVSLLLLDINGAKIECPTRYENGVIYFEKGDLAPGLYIFSVRDNEGVIGSGKVVLQ